MSTPPISVLDLQQAVQGVTAKVAAPTVSASNVQYVDSTNTPTTDLAVPVGGRFLINGTDFVPGGGYVFFVHNGVQETVSAAAKYVSDTQMVVEYTPDMGTDTKTVQPIVMGGGGLAVSQGYLEYDGGLRIDDSDIIVWKGSSFSFDLGSLVTGSTNTTITVPSTPGISSSNGIISGSFTMPGSNTETTILDTTVRDENKKVTARKDIPLVSIGSDYMFSPKGEAYSGSVFLQLSGGIGKTLGLFTDTDVSFSERFSPSVGGLRLSGSLSGKKIISLSGKDSYATFAVTEDGHVHGRGSQVALSANVSNWYSEAYTSSCHLGLGEQNAVTHNDFVDFTETYGWHLCRQVMATQTGYLYITKTGKMYGWGRHYYRTSSNYNTILYIPFLTQYTQFSSSSTTQRIQGYPTLVASQPSGIIGMTKGQNYQYTTIAWTKYKVYIQGFAGSPNYGTNSGLVYHSEYQGSTDTFRDISNDNHNNGNTVESIRNKEIKQCVFASNARKTTHLWILATDGTLHLRWSRYYYSNTAGTYNDGYDSSQDPFMTNNLQNVHYCTQSTHGALGGRTFTKLGAGAWNFAALASNGDFVTWGRNQYGECGVNSTSGSYATVINANGSLAGKQVSDFVCIPYGTVIKDIDGGLHFCGRVTDDTFVGIFGVPLYTTFLVPTPFPIQNP